MDNVLGRRDLLSDLPQGIIETILTKLPIRDAVRTSILSSKWRYRWATLTQLVFDDTCVTPSKDKALVENKLVKLITRLLFLHDGPIHQFMLCTSYLKSSPDIDQWLLFLSRKDIQELVLELGNDEWFRAPSCLFDFRKLTNLDLVRCELDLPPTFNGFLSLKYLYLQQVLIAPDAVERLISSCPLLESLTLSSLDSFALTIHHAPNLKDLCLMGEFKDVCLENTPLLVHISIAMHMTDDDIAEHFERSSSCNFDKFFGGLPCLEQLLGHFDFTKYLSIGYDGLRPITYHHLKLVELCRVSFEDTREILVVLRLIENSPNLQELRIWGSPKAPVAAEAPDLDFWEKESLSDSCCTFGKLEIVKMNDMSGVPREMGLIKFLLEKSPVLQIMSITPGIYATGERLNMLIELVRFRRASAKAEIIFIPDDEKGKKKKMMMMMM